MLSSLISFALLLCLSAAQQPVSYYITRPEFDSHKHDDNHTRNGLIGGIAGLAGLLGTIGALAALLRGRNYNKYKPAADLEKQEQPPILHQHVTRRHSAPLEPILEANTPLPSSNARQESLAPPAIHRETTIVEEPTPAAGPTLQKFSLGIIPSSRKATPPPESRRLSEHPNKPIAPKEEPAPTHARTPSPEPVVRAYTTSPKPLSRQETPPPPPIPSRRPSEHPNAPITAEEQRRQSMASRIRNALGHP